MDSGLAENVCMLRGGLPRELSIADQAPALALTDCGKHFADLVSVDGARVSLRFFVSSHVYQQ